MSLSFMPPRLAALLAVALALPTAAPAQTPSAADPADRAGEVGAVLDIAAGEYALAVPEGELVDSLEYAETRLMLEQARDLAGPLLEDGPAGSRLATALDSAVARVDRVAAASAVRAAIDEARGALFEGWGGVALARPPESPSAERGAELYAAHCAACHGARGRGDGPAGTMTPPPTDFTDPAHVMEASPSRLFQVLSYGIPGTAMEGWRDRLEVQERWDLVSYVARLGHTKAERTAGAALYRSRCSGCHEVGGAAGREGGSDGTTAPDLTRLDGLAGISGVELEALLAEGHGSDAAGAGALSDSQVVALLAHLKTFVERTGGPRMADSGAPARVAAEVEATLDRAVELHAAGRYDQARRAALGAYMTFEGLERELRVRAPEDARALEREFLTFREAADDPDADLADIGSGLTVGLRDAVARLDRPPTRWSSFLGSLVIIVREGFEAILIIGALVTFLVRSGNAEHRPSVYAGIGLAIAASLLTALAIEFVFQVAPASQEALEGATLLLAVVVLFSVSYWLVSKVAHERWEEYIRSKMNLAISRRSGLALASVAFLAVYREGFETVLFYKALMGTAQSTVAVVAGFAVGTVALAVLWLTVYRFGVRIPMRPFFSLTSGLLYVMAFIFAGQGVRELQEAGIVGATGVAGVPQIGPLGVYPTLESLTLQGVLLAALVIGLLWTFRLAPGRAAVAKGPD